MKKELKKYDDLMDAMVQPVTDIYSNHFDNEITDPIVCTYMFDEFKSFAVIGDSNSLEKLMKKFSEVKECEIMAVMYWKIGINKKTGEQKRIFVLQYFSRYSSLESNTLDQCFTLEKTDNPEAPIYTTWRSHDENKPYYIPEFALTNPWIN